MKEEILHRKIPSSTILLTSPQNIPKIIAELIFFNCKFSCGRLSLVKECTSLTLYSIDTHFNASTKYTF